MKQHITIDQLNELSEKGKERLREWWKPEVGDWFITRYSSLYYIYGRPDDNDEDYGEPQLLTRQETDSGYYGWDLGDTFPNEESQESGYSYTGDQKARGIEILKDALPLLSIGQMIEFLEEHKFLRKSHWENTDSNATEVAWIHNICDNLWEAVKEVLNA
jgi:hypothetical protein